MGLALIVSAGANANEYLARHIAELGYTRPVIVASGGEARRQMDARDFEVIVINTPLPAIADAVYNAIGTRFYELPITPEQIAMAVEETR